MTLDAALALKKAGDELYVMIHYPPFNPDGSGGFTDIIEAYPVNSVVYGHIHGANRAARLITQRGAVTYYLTSCDMINNKLIKIR
jgi:predicted phosphohydrolase